ncbi:HAD family hydrolase [Irregularibacter muris]|uniref:HAD family hydrolase n=1 Tax=Irregularibacter muris TaxID=1796619 RepID=A0AAE3L2D0_9FIRM|nr:HAD family hydrolase [Irregularibacter muris]MCR1898289.1 HAD family hydrolase [Irregularibacter muris]
MYKMVVLDLDGTLFNSQTMVSEKNKRAIQACMERGVKVVLASGRMHGFMMPLVRDLNLHHHSHVACNGNTIFTHHGQTEDVAAIDDEVYRNLVKRYKKENLEIAAFSKDCIYYEKAPRLLEVFSRSQDGQILQVEALEELTGILKMVIYVREENVQEEKRIREITKEDATILRTYHLFVDVVGLNVSKYKALERLIKEQNIDPKQVIAIGDSENDVEMITNVGLGVAMANGSENLKKLAKYITPKTNDEDGVAEVIERFVLKKIS